MNVNIKNQLVSRVAKTIMYVGKNPGKNLKEISKDLDIDYNFISKIIQRCEEDGIVTVEMVSRDKRVTLTEKGKAISKSSVKIEKSMDE